MSKYGPEIIRNTVQPLLDAIAPDCAINLLELRANQEARAQDATIKPIAVIGWQHGFFHKKIYEPLLIDVLKLNGAWDDDVTPAQQLTDMIAYFQNQHKGIVSPLGETIDTLLRNAKDYLRQIHVSARSHIDNPQELDYFEGKAEIAFFRMVNIVLAFHAKNLFETFKEADYPLFNQFLVKAGLEPCTLAQRSHFLTLLDNFINQNASFTEQELRQFRYHKAKTQSRTSALLSQDDHRAYYGGASFDATRVSLSNWRDLSFWQLGSQLCRYTMYGTFVKLQQTGLTRLLDFRKAIVEEDLGHFKKAVLAVCPSSAALHTVIELPQEVKLLLGKADLQKLFEDIAVKRFTLCKTMMAVPPTEGVTVEVDFERLIGQPHYLPSTPDLKTKADDLGDSLVQAIMALNISEADSKNKLTCGL